MIEKEKIAKTIRVVSVPPIMVTLLFVILFSCKRELFNDSSEAIIPIFFLGLVPVLAYPYQRLSPRFKMRGREAQRKLAFVFSLVGYSAAFVWAIFTQVHKEILLVCMSYFFSAVILAIINKFFHIKASGHACSIAGPLVLLVLLLDWRLAFPAAVFAVLVAWASVYLKRHTCKQFIGGACVYLIALFLTDLFVKI